ncbi:MAG: serine/threonine-protein kinase [Planctomycetota bacterium]
MINDESSDLALHPEIDDLHALVDGTLSDRQTVAFESHLNHCGFCQERLLDLAAQSSFHQELGSILTRADFSSSEDQDSDIMEVSQTDATTPFSVRTLSCLLDPSDDAAAMGRFDGYDVQRVIGVGGMGIVLKARDRSLDRYVAIKVLHEQFASRSISRKRFAQEAKAAAAVSHDNVIAIHGVSQWKGLLYLVMPCISGPSLQQHINQHAPLNLGDMLRIAIQVARGLSAAHDQGLVHRDVKPANILMPLGTDRVLLTDFGLARMINDADCTATGTLVGTPQYMSPEQVGDGPIDGRSDLFALGCVIVAMATGQPPFEADSTLAIIRKITDVPHQRLSDVRHDLPKWFVEIVDRLLEKAPDRRFADAAEVVEMLETCLAHLQQPESNPLPTVGRRSRHTVQWLVLGAAVIGALIATLPVLFIVTRSTLPQDDALESRLTTTPVPATSSPASATTVESSFDEHLLIEVEREVDWLQSEFERPFAATPIEASSR